MIYENLYDFYVEEGIGDLTEATFERYAPAAIAFVRRLTNCRIDYIQTTGTGTDTTLVESVKRAICAVIEASYETDNSVAAESNDGVSVTYKSSNDSKGKRLHDAAAVYLDVYGLLYRGL